MKHIFSAPLKVDRTLRAAAFVSGIYGAGALIFSLILGIILLRSPEENMIEILKELHLQIQSVHPGLIGDFLQKISEVHLGNLL